MKPKSGPDCCRRPVGFPRERTPKFPVTDSSFQEFPLDRFRDGLPNKPDPSFLNISREYFRYEARRNFLGEAAFFLALTAILALTFISGALVIIRFLQLPEA